MPFPCYNVLMKMHTLILITILSMFFTACGVKEPERREEQRQVKIAVIDTGFSGRAIPAENVLEGKNYLDETLSTEDTYGHGTAVASVILQNCSDALLVPLVSNVFENGKILQVENDRFAQIIRDAVDVYECDIINISAGLILDKDSVYDAIQYAEEMGVLVVASVGNDYQPDQPCKYYPAAYETVLAVGSVDKEGKQISEFSQRGEWVNLYVCGEDVTISTLSGNTRISEGTSYSAAKVSAYAAQMILQAEKYSTPEEIRKMLLHQTQEMESGENYILKR